jgi:hypothetical protein
VLASVPTASHVDSYHQWLDSVKVLSKGGQLESLGLQERLDLMERSVVKQAQELEDASPSPPSPPLTRSPTDRARKRFSSPTSPNSRPLIPTPPGALLELEKLREGFARALGAHRPLPRWN